ncbi:MAG TPA: DNA polymerase III subunit gamma/tau [Dysgonamonadaceae bacterium]|nr:DNA polymerase III subunit gamma/tau [Dysgonamonadaceae bacterium]
MDNYIVSARKYRPATFKSVIGQDALTTTLKNAISNNKLAHAYLFCGPRGVGKTTCARIFAKTINCFNLTPDNESCNKCESCVAFNESRSYNIHEMDAASNNSVEDIRDLIDQVRIAPQVGKYKVYIIDEVHMLSTQAFNSFLKTLEEPPKHAIFILATTEKHKIIPTILSRCQVYDFNRINLADIVEYLNYVAKEENVTVEQEALNIIAQKADGGMRDALSIFDQTVSYTAGNVTYQAVIDNLNVLDYEYYFKLTDAILEGSVVDSLLIINEILGYGFDGQHVISGMASHFRNLMISKDPRSAMLFEVGASIKERYIDTAKKCSNEFLYKAIDIANECDLNYRMSQNKRLLLELAFIRMCQLSDGVGETDKKTTIKEIDKSQTTRTYVAKQETDSKVEEKEEKVEKEVATESKTESKTKEQTEEAEKTKKPSRESRLTERDPHHEEVLREKKRKEISRKENKPEETKKKPSSATGRPRTFSIANHGVSISSMDDNDEDEDEDEAIRDSNKKRIEEFTEEVLVKAWESYTETLEEEKLLKNTMSLYLPKKVNDTIFEVTVNTEINKQYLDNNIGAIMNWLKDELKNDFIEMNILISETIVNQRPFTSREIFDVMAEENPVLRKLSEKLGLELK